MTFYASKRSKRYYGARQHPCEHALAKHARYRYVLVYQCATLAATEIASRRHNARGADGIHYACCCSSLHVQHANSVAACRVVFAWLQAGTARRYTRHAVARPESSCIRCSSKYEVSRQQHDLAIGSNVVAAAADVSGIAARRCANLYGLTSTPVDIVKCGSMRGTTAASVSQNRLGTRMRTIAVHTDCQSAARDFTE